jgi:hypothetical protein
MKDNKILKEILKQVKSNEISIEKAHDTIITLLDNESFKTNDSGDFRDPQNYESQSEYFGR